MSNEKTYSREFKAAVVLEAVAAETDDPGNVLDTHGVTASQVLSWAKEMDISSEKLAILIKLAGGDDEPSDSHDSFEIESNDDLFFSEVEHGVTSDKLNYARLIFWSVFGTGFVVISVLALQGIYIFSTDQIQQQVSSESVYYEAMDKETRDRETLSSYGVVDLEAGTYRVPIDSVISRMADE